MKKSDLKVGMEVEHEGVVVTVTDLTPYRAVEIKTPFGYKIMVKADELLYLNSTELPLKSLEW